jgi:hypothetical protein
MVAKPRRQVELPGPETRLRSESPAYSPEEEWESHEPQGMSVVVSVRLDPVSARRLAAIAEGEHRTPSALVRKWTLEHLADSDTALTTRAIGEARPDYEVPPDDFESMRQQYRPPDIKVLLVGESRPAAGTFFYLANSHLFFATREAFVRGRGSAAYGEVFLGQLQQNGVWLYDLAFSPVNQLAGRPRREAVAERITDLVELLRESNPATVVTIKRSLESVVRSAMDSAGISLDRLVALPFPLYQWREEYVKGLARIFRQLDA